MIGTAPRLLSDLERRSRRDGDALIAQKERNRDGLPGLKLHAACRAIEIAIDGHSDAANLLPGRNQ